MEGPGPSCRNDENGANGEDQHRFRPRRYYRWAELMQRVFEIDVLVCEHCGGRRRVLTFLTDPPVLRRILEHLGLPAEPPPVHPARPPPEPELLFSWPDNQAPPAAHRSIPAFALAMREKLVDLIPPSHACPPARHLPSAFRIAPRPGKPGLYRLSACTAEVAVTGREMAARIRGVFARMGPV